MHCQERSPFDASWMTLPQIPHMDIRTRTSPGPGERGTKSWKRTLNPDRHSARIFDSGGMDISLFACSFIDLHEAFEIDLRAELARNAIETRGSNILYVKDESAADPYFNSNSGFTLYTHSGSTVALDNDVTMTFLGGEDISTDNINTATTWTAINEGSPYHDALEKTLIKRSA